MEESPLYKLPGELRNRIYELALFQPGGITVFVSALRPHLFKPTDTSNILALTEICKDIRHESSPIVYETNKFSLISKYLGEQYSGDIRTARNTQWETGLCVWLHQLGKRNVNALSHVEIDIGTSFLYNYVPSSESIWRSVASVLDHFHEETLVCMKTELDWTYESRRGFAISIPLSDPAAARQAVHDALEEQRRELVPWCEENHAGARRTEYMRVELATCAQELNGFVHLLEIMHRNSRP
jgi:hypothetical protein